MVFLHGHEATCSLDLLHSLHGSSHYVLLPIKTSFLWLLGVRFRHVVMLPATALAPIQLRRGSWFVGENPNSGESLSWPGVLVQCFAESGYGELLAGNKRQEWSRAFCWSRWASEPHGKPHRSSRKNSQNAKDLGFSPLSLLPWLHFAPLVQSCSFSRKGDRTKHPLIYPFSMRYQGNPLKW